MKWNVSFPSSARFPIILQLMILVVIMGAVFSTALVRPFVDHGSDADALHTATPAALASLTPQKLIDIPLSARAAYVWDVRDQRTLFTKNPGESLPLASITKLMTALVSHELIPDTNEISIPEAALRQEGSNGLSVHDTFTAHSLSDFALLSSSNDAAYALGASAGKLLEPEIGSAAFIEAMNIRAAELGFSSLRFSNATGLDLTSTEAGAYGSARDVTFLLEYIYRNYPEIIEATSNESIRVYNETGDYYDLTNTNEIVSEIPNLLGSKTGYTDLAGGNLTVIFDAGFNRPIIITVLGSTRSERFTDVDRLVKAVTDAIVVTQ